MSDWEGAHQVCIKALNIVQGKRNEAYDDPELNHYRIAKVWSGVLDEKLVDDISAADVCRMMIGLKLVRDAHSPAEDNRIDTIGYALNLERVEPTVEREEYVSIPERINPFTECCCEKGAL